MLPYVQWQGSYISTLICMYTTEFISTTAVLKVSLCSVPELAWPLLKSSQSLANLCAAPPVLVRGQDFTQVDNEAQIIAWNIYVGTLTTT